MEVCNKNPAWISDTSTALSAIEKMNSLKNIGVRMGVVSNTTNPRFMKENEMQATGLAPFFDFAIYSSDAPYRKPHPSIFQLAIESLKLKPEEILFVGDTAETDIIGAQSVGMKTAWIRMGRSYPLENKPDFEIDHVKELGSILNLF